MTQLRNRFAHLSPAMRRHLLTAFVVLSVLMLSAVAALAQTSEPPTITIPTDVVFASTNSWIVTFAPIAAIGIGITIALAVLAYLGKMIASAFKG